MPCAVILFHSDLDFSQACAFCSDMDIDVLETEIYGYSCFFATSVVFLFISIFSSKKKKKKRKLVDVKVRILFFVWYFFWKLI